MSFMERVAVRNLFSFGDDEQSLWMTPVTVLVGANNAGKTNFLKCLRLFQHAPIWPRHRPLSVHRASQESDAVAEYGTVEALITGEGHGRFAFLHTLQVRDDRYMSERLMPREPSHAPAILRGMVPSPAGGIGHHDWKPTANRAFQNYRDMTFLGMDDDVTAPTAEWAMRAVGRLKPGRMAAMGEVIRALDETVARVEAGDGDSPLRIIDHWGRRVNPAYWSAHTLRFMVTAATLLAAERHSVIAIEEPDAGLHPDLTPELHRLVIEASAHAQVIFTTNRYATVDMFTDTPEYVVAVENAPNGTVLNRAKAELVLPFLENREARSLTDLWSQGHLGGNRY